MAHLFDIKCHFQRALLWRFSAAEWKALVFSVSSSSEMKCEEEVVFLALLRKKLKKRQKFGPHTFLTSMRISGIFHALLNGTLLFSPLHSPIKAYSPIQLEGLHLR
jgi:hypothetical protein